MTKKQTKKQTKEQTKNLQQKEAATEHAVVRNYKDSIFRMIFSEPSELLVLYNALNGSHYTDPSRLEIKTLKNAIYMNIKNDISFLIDTRLYLYEHQSTWSPNMPLRDLLYVADQMQALTKSKDLYQSTPIKIPAPDFVVFYNGTTRQPERAESRLSDLYEIPTDKPKLELIVTTLNINLGCNRELMEKCRALRDYAIYVDKVRTYAKTMDLEPAVRKAVDECIRNDILKEFLLKEKAEAIKVSIYEFNQEKHEEILKEESWAGGKAEGKAEGLAEGRAEGLVEGKAEGKAEGLAEGKAEGLVEGRAEGLAEGQAKTLMKNILTVLSSHGSIPENIKTAIMEEKDIAHLDEMFQKAVLFQSIEKFAEEFKLIKQ